MEEIIKQVFPNLSLDTGFKITSKQDTRYNCIAWAAFFSDRFMWPPYTHNLDGVFYYWPEGIDKDERIETFVKLFESYGYAICTNSTFDPNYRKIALYKNTLTGFCTHAARQLSSGLWTSKLGKEHDISHSTPEALESTDYGVVAHIMQKSKTK